MNPKTTLAVIIGIRDFFPDRLVTEARQDILALADELGLELVLVDENATKLGAVEMWEHAKTSAALFKINRDKTRQDRTSLHTVYPTAPEFKADLAKFIGVYRVVR